MAGPKAACPAAYLMDSRMSISFAKTSSRSLLTKARAESCICNGTVIARLPVTAQPVRSDFAAAGDSSAVSDISHHSRGGSSVSSCTRQDRLTYPISRQKIVEKHVSFFNQKKRPSADHVLPRTPPQIHHKSTTSETRISQKPPAKSRLAPQSSTTK